MRRLDGIAWRREIAQRDRAIAAMKATLVTPEGEPLPDEVLREAIDALEALPPHARMAHQRVLGIYRDMASGS